MQLLFPVFLIGLLAVMIPIIIHLLQLRKPQRVSFTNTEFIKQLDLIVARQQRLKQLLLLALRALAITFLVFAFCQPFIPAQKVSAGNLRSGVQVLIDTSPSMQVTTQNNETLFQAAIAQAQGLEKSAGAQMSTSLLNSITKNRTLTNTIYRNELQTLKMTGRPTNLSEIINNKSKNKLEPISKLYVFSDFQKSGASTKLISALGTTRETVLVPEIGKQVANVFVDSIWFNEAFVRVRTNVGLHIRVRNGGQKSAVNCPVKVFLGPQQVAAFQISVAAGQSVVSTVQVQVADRALALGRVVTEDKPATFDNTYYFTLQPASQIRIVEVGPEPIAQRLYSNEPAFSYAYNRPDEINYGLLKAANLVVVREVPQVAAGLQEALREVMKRGGSVVVVPAAAESSRISYQQLFRALGVGNTQWQAATAAPELREVAMPSAQNPFFQDVFGAQQRQATMPRATPVLRWARTDDDILKFRDGDSYLAGFRVGTGRAYIFSAPFETRYSDFASHALFVPVLYRLAMLSYRNDQLPAYRLTQPALTLTVPEGGRQADEARYQLIKDSLTLIPGQRTQGQELRLEIPTDLAEPGFYQLRRQGQLITTLAFNQDKRESELAAYSVADLRRLLVGHPNVHVLEGDDDMSGAVAHYQAQQMGQPLWRYCLVAALACLLAEALLLRWGRRSSAVGMGWGGRG